MAGLNDEVIVTKIPEAVGVQPLVEGLVVEMASVLTTKVVAEMEEPVDQIMMAGAVVTTVMVEVVGERIVVAQRSASQPGTLLPLLPWVQQIPCRLRGT